MRQSEQNEQMHAVRNSDTFINQYASGPQQSAGFSTNGGQIRDMNNYQNSYRVQDTRHTSRAIQHGESDVYLPPEVKTTGNPFNVDTMDQWEGETEGSKFHVMDEKDRQDQSCHVLF